MNHTAEVCMAGARAALAQLKTDAALPEPERLECFYLLACDAGDLINDTLAKMRNSMTGAEINQVVARLKRPERKRTRRK